MDKKNFTIGAVLVVAAILVMRFAPSAPPTTHPQNAQSAVAPSQPTTSAPAAAAPADSATAAAPASAAPAPTPNGPTSVGATAEYAGIYRDPADPAIVTLENDFIVARFTAWGGAVREVAFKKHPVVQGGKEPYVFNHLAEEPILAFANYPGLGRETRYEVVTASASEVVFKTTLNGRIEVTRRYSFLPPGTPGGDSYRLRHETTFRNLTDKTESVASTALSIGTAALMNSADTGQHLNIVNYDGNSVNYIERGALAGGGFGSLFGRGNPPLHELAPEGQTVWAAAKNQFFASIYTPDTTSKGVLVHRLNLTPLAPFADQRLQNIALSGGVRFDLPPLAPNATAKIGGALYVGPQEYARLKHLGHNEDKVLPYTQYFFNRIFFSGIVAPLQNLLLTWVHSWAGNWGVAVIIMTLFLKFISLPFTLAASRSAKRMAKLQPLMQEIREKYKDNPQKQQAATMELFKTHKVNPIGGCIPILITFPLFVGFFAMLQGAAELRFQSFLWASDLSAQDTVAHIFGFPINIMPLLMGATMFYQMKLTPTPSVDNMQMKMMRFMPLIFTAFCYFFSCALALYSTINGLFTIVQQIVINKMRDPEEAGPAGPGTAAATTAAAWGKKPVKNVTPKKGDKR